MYSISLENELHNVVNINDGINYLTLNIEGLNPPSADIYRIKSPNKKGSKYNGSTLDERAVHITIKLLGDVEKNRNALYDWIDSESYIKIRYSNGAKSIYCEGYVEEVEIKMFTSNEEIELAIICPDPYLKDINDIVTEISRVINQFTFPFSIDSEGIPFSTLRDSNNTNIFNSGSETGIKITLEFTGNVTNPTIYNANNTSEYFTINKSFVSGEVVVIDTDKSPRTVKLYKTNGTVENILKYVAANSTWFTLKRGNNVFSFDATTGENNILMTISFTNKYLGV